MKRPPGLWLLLTTVLVWLCIEEVYSLKATSLIFGKTSTTTTTGSSDTSEAGAGEGVTQSSGNVTEDNQQNSTKPVLTGIPQIDYVYDPNLPRELNGYNLSEYPFYDRVPEDIVFKCDGLHDGFYASIIHKCQVYHHCLFGTRFDFLCANYTAFDQRTFICHFVSEVDCVNSKKFWHRNDALYQAASTTTPKPVVVTQPPVPATPVPIVPLFPRRPMGGRRRRPQRRRPQYDYYYDDEEDDDYYEEPRRRKRPRYRPRPAYDDEYEEEYEEDKHERGRPNGRRGEDRERRPYNRRGPSDRRRNNGDRRKYDEEDYEDNTREDDRKKRPNNEDRDDDRREKRPSTKRRPSDDDYETRSQERPSKGQRRPPDDEYEDEIPLKEDRRSYDRPRKNNGDGDRRSSDKPKKNDGEGRRPYDRPKSSGEEGRTIFDRPKKNNDNEDNNRKYDRPRKNDGTDVTIYEDKIEEDQLLIKPTSGSSVYDRPRAAPRIRPPVPKTEQNKYSYKTVTIKSSTKAPIEEEYYDDYEEEPVPKGSTKQESESRRPSKTNNDEVRDNSRTDNKSNSKDVRNNATENDNISRQNVRDKPKNSRGEVENNPYHRKSSGSRREQSTRRPENYDDDYYDDEIVTRRSNSRPKSDSEQPKGRRVNISTRKRPLLEDYEDSDEDRHAIKNKPGKTILTTTTKEPPRDRPEPVVKVVKRPFLPSRGGSPYTPRGLQPVGAKAVSANNSKVEISEGAQETQKVMEGRKSENSKSLPENTETSTKSTQELRAKVTKTNSERNQEHLNAKQNGAPLIETFKPPPIVVKNPIRTKYLANNEDEFKPVSNRPGDNENNKAKDTPINEIKSTEKPKIANISPLDIDENEYDVTLNDALNPTLPNLPVRGFPTGFSAPNDYTYNGYQGSRYVVDPTLNQASSDYVYRIKQPIQRLENQHFNSGGNQFVGTDDTSVRYSAPPVYQHFRQSPRLTQAQTQPFFTSY